jgi:hypothetical protein
MLRLSSRTGFQNNIDMGMASKGLEAQIVSGYQLSAPEETLFDSAHWMPDETPTANVAVWFRAVAVQYQADRVYALVLRPDAVA